jgi:hypothetical protein
VQVGTIGELWRYPRSGLDADRLRFRPNLFVDTGEARGFPESKRPIG